jgi:hypothetical protein
MEEVSLSFIVWWTGFRVLVLGSYIFFGAQFLAGCRLLESVVAAWPSSFGSGAVVWVNLYGGVLFVV